MNNKTKVRMRADLAKRELNVFGRIIEEAGDLYGQIVELTPKDFDDVDAYLADKVGNVVLSVSRGERLIIVDSIDLEFYESEEL
jgi:hypothetical protein